MRSNRTQGGGYRLATSPDMCLRKAARANGLYRESGRESTQVLPRQPKDGTTVSGRHSSSNRSTCSFSENLASPLEGIPQRITAHSLSWEPEQNVLRCCEKKVQALYQSSVIETRAACDHELFSEAYDPSFGGADRPKKRQRQNAPSLLRHSLG